MKEKIEPSHVVVSPHRGPYEEFFQFDRFRNKQDFDKDSGLYGLLSTIFPIEYQSSSKKPCERKSVFPTKRKDKALTENEIEEKVLAALPENHNLYAFKEIKLPGEDKPLVAAGKQITPEARVKIVNYNKKALKIEGLKPLKQITLLTPKPEEQKIVQKWIHQDDFDPEQLRRKINVSIQLKDYKIGLPPSLLVNDGYPDDSEHFLKELDALECRCRNRGDTLRMAVKATLAIEVITSLAYKKEEGEITARTNDKTATIGYFPIFTEQHTFIIDGQERVPVVQLLPRPGLHLHRATEDAPFCALIRPKRGLFLEIEIPENAEKGGSGRAQIRVGKYAWDFIMFLKDMGFYGDIRNVLESADKTFPGDKDTMAPPEGLSSDQKKKIRKMFNDDSGYDLGSEARKSLNERLAETYSKIKKVSPLGQTKHLCMEDIAGMFIFLLEASAKGSAVVDLLDDPMDLENKQVRLISDHVKELIELQMPSISKQIIDYLEISNDASSIPLNFSNTNKTSKNLGRLFKGELCQINNDINPLSELSLKRKVTLLGPKGIPEPKYAPMKLRGVHFSHYGRICLTETPESDRIGFNLHLALTARIEDGAIKAPYTLENPENGPRWLSIAEENSHDIAPAGCNEYLEQDNKFLARKERGDAVREESSKNITLYDRYRAQFLGIGANLIPFVQHDDNNRVMMGAKNMKQALPLLHPEAPLIKTGREDLVARLSGHVIYAKNRGVVEKVLEREIVVKTGEDNDKMDSYLLNPLRPTSANTIRWHKPLVRKGDKVEKGRVLADGACTSNGQLALGANLLCAYMPYYGLNFEDGIVVSDRLVKENVLTSVHLNVVKFDVYGNERMRSEEKIEEMYPFSRDEGVFCREGGEIKKNDQLFGKYRTEVNEKKTIWLKSPANGTIIDIMRQDVNPATERPSQVRYRVICQILEERKIRVGDKLMGRHGNKGVISRIVPAAKMPHLQDGTPIDIILNPHGVISRMNLGQILETHLGWIVKHGGERYQHFSTVAPFERIGEDRIREAFKDLKNSGIDEFGKAILTDGMTGQAIENPVTVGYQYIIKLNHLAGDKLNVRETEAYTLLTKQPPKGKTRKGGQRIGEMEGWALQAHMAWHILQEFMTVKADAVNMRRGDLAEEYFDKESKISSAVPFQETLRVTAMLLKGLCLNMTFHDSEDNAINMDSEWLSDLDHIQLRLAGPGKIKGWADKKEVDKSERPSVKRGKVQRADKGLFDLSIFEDSRKSMAYINLVEPVIHPLFIRDFERFIKEQKREKNGPEYLKKLFEKAEATNIRSALRFKTAVVHGPEEKKDEAYYRVEFSSVPGKYKGRACKCGMLIQENAVSGACSQCKKRFRKKDLFTRFKAGALLVKYLLGDELQDPLKNALLTAVPVLPSDYRPLWATHGEIRVKSELNDFYRDVITANEKLKNALESNEDFSEEKFFEMRARLQQAVNRLMVGDKKTAKEDQKSIGDRIKGKEGILRMCHLGKRVDVSARGVIVPQPELALDQAGIPLEMAAGLVGSKLIAVLADKCRGTTQKEKRASALEIFENMAEPLYRDMIQKALFDPQEGLFKDAMVVLTRAPSLHKYNILAFHPVCVDHQAIGLHPLACKFFNADFDGDQMGVFVPLSTEALDEAKTRLSPSKNLLSAANGKPMLSLSQDVVLGIYLLTSDEEGRKTFNGWFGESDIPPVTVPVTGKDLSDLVHKYHVAMDNPAKTVEIAQRIMEEGFKRATLSGMTFSIFDVPFLDKEKRDSIIGACLTPEDWKNTVEKNLESELKMEKGSPVAAMVRSGARGGMKQIVQLGGMRGELSDINNHPLSPQVKRNFREGISPLEYYIGSHSARRSMCEKKLMTAPAGDFTRLMVEAAYRMIIKGDDCGTGKGVHISPFPETAPSDFQGMPSFNSRIVGRVKINGDVIDEAEALRLREKGEPVQVHSVLTCEAEKKWGHGGALCQKCYGWDLSTRHFPEMGLPVGILAGESIGERGTQLTMQTFHTGGVGGGGVTLGLPRIKKIFSNGVLMLPVFKVLDQGNTELEKGALVHEWALLIAVSKTKRGGKPPQVERCSDAFEKAKLGDILSDNDFDKLRIILAYEAQRLYKGAVDEKHFEVILRSMCRDGKNKLSLVGIRKAAAEQPGFLAAASFQKSLNVFATAALEEKSDHLEGYKERLITGQRIKGEI